jgi:hypothetical protein
MLLLAAASAWWWLPKFQMRSITVGDPKARADIEDNFRKTVGQALGGMVVLIGAGIAYYGTQQTLRVNEDQARLGQQAAHDLLISNQVAKGFDQLASGNRIVRLGGIYALEGAMNTSELYYQSLLEALCAFVRENTSTEVSDEPPPSDIQAALKVIGRRSAGTGKLDLFGIHVSRVNLFKADLTGADLTGADLIDANMTDAILTRANLTGANITRARLFGANLTGANLTGANLAGALVIGSNMSQVDLTGANLIGANLTGTILSGAILTSVNLSGANLSGAGLNGTKVLQLQLDTACGSGTTLPPGLSLKTCASFSPNPGPVAP